VRQVDYFEQMRFDSLERAYLYLEPPDIDEVLPYDDWWYTLEDSADFREAIT